MVFIHGQNALINKNYAIELQPLSILSSKQGYQ